MTCAVCGPREAVTVSSGRGPGWPLPSPAGAPLGEPSGARFADRN